MNVERYNKLDRQHVWHPYTKFSTIDGGPLPVISRGEGVYLVDAQGNRYLDAISSWWSSALGHSHPRMIEAIGRQATQLQHSILGNLSHPRAVELATRLAALMPTPDRHVLFSSDGASAVEAALKIALQYWHNHGETSRRTFAYLENAYHGDTLGAVSVGYLEEFHKPFEAVLTPAFRLPVPYGGDDMEAASRELADLLHEHSAELAGVIVEPLCQCASGMRMYPPEYLTLISALCREKRVLLIADEIATGFGRTGTTFAFEQAGIDPDIVCVGKALSAGYLPISAAIVKDEIYRTFGDVPADHTFYHGHTFCGNPIACAAALEALRIYHDEGVIEQAKKSGELLRDLVAPLAELPQVAEVRCLGMIVAVELEPEDPTPATPRPQRVRAALFDRHILLRPLGRVVYLMPPLVTPEIELRGLASALADAIREAG